MKCKKESLPVTVLFHSVLVAVKLWLLWSKRFKNIFTKGQIMTSFQNLKVEVTGAIAKVTMNRPSALNALNRQTLEELYALFSNFLPNQNVRGVILTGEGDKAFVAG